MQSITIQKTDSGWSKVYVAGHHLGGFGKTTHKSDAMRWYWSGNGTFDHCATRDEAIDGLRKQVPAFLGLKAAEKAQEAEFAALPADLQVLKTEMDRAEFERQRVWGRNPFNPVDYASASTLAHQAYTAFHVAHDAWQSRRVAA